MMSAHFASTKQFWTGCLYTVIGGIALFVAQDYRMGTLERMGPAYFPTALAALLVVIGIACMVRAALHGGEPVAGIAWRPLVLITLATAGFGFLLPLLGLPLALVAMIAIGTVASRQFSFDLGFVVSMVFFVVCCIGLFVYALSLSMPLLGSLFEGIGA